MPKQKFKLGQILRKEILQFPSLNTKYSKIVPVFRDTERKKFQRKVIIHLHSVFQNEVRNNYTSDYIDTVTDLLFQNEDGYSKKRQSLSIKSYSRAEQLSKLKTSFSSRVTKDASSSSNEKEMRNSNSKKTVKPYFSRECLKVDPQDSLLTPSRKKNKTDSDRLLKIVHMSDKMKLIYQNNFRNLILRRVDNIKKVNCINTFVNEENPRNKRSISNLTGGKQFFNQTVKTPIKIKKYAPRLLTEI